MRINHNINALNSQGFMLKNIAKSGKSMEKLSSGLRINKAGDDAAGLAISEKMRGQIRGLDQASRNAQDGISLIQTAEGALSETHSILQRMRELSTQASNDTNTAEDRNKIQEEINQLVLEIDRIGNDTEFNTKKLLNSGGVPKDVRDNIINGLKTGWLEVAEKVIKDAYGLTGGGSTKLKVTIGSGAEYGELAHVGGTSAVLELYIDAEDFKQGDGEHGDNIHGKLYNDRIIAHEMTHAVMDDALGVNKMNSMPTWFIEGTAEFIAGADERLKKVIGNSGLTAVDPSKRSNLINRASELLGGAAWAGDDMDYSAGYVIVKYMSQKLNSANNMKSVMTQIQSAATSDGEVSLNMALGIVGTTNSISSITNLKTSFDSNTNAADFINGITLNWGTNETDVGSISGSDHKNPGTPLNAESVIDEGTASDKTDGQPLQNFEVIWPTEDDFASDVKLQVGANKGQTFTVKLKDMRSAALNINDVQVMTHENASAAIGKLDDALEKVSDYRAELGSAQNRLEHTITNLNNASENLTTSESRIRDVDMSKEMMNFSKNNILQQAAQAMLAQANQQPQGVLQLLR